MFAGAVRVDVDSSIHAYNTAIGGRRQSGIHTVFEWEVLDGVSAFPRRAEARRAFIFRRSHLLRRRSRLVVIWV